MVWKKDTNLRYYVGNEFELQIDVRMVGHTKAVWSGKRILTLRYYFGKENNNRYRLLQLCRYNNLVIANIEFSHKMAHKLTGY